MVGIKRIKRIHLLRKQLLRTGETIPIPIKEIFPSQEATDLLQGLEPHVHKYACVIKEINHQEITVIQTGKKNTTLLLKLWILIMILIKKTMIPTFQKNLMTKYQIMKIMRHYRTQHQTILL